MLSSSAAVQLESREVLERFDHLLQLLQLELSVPRESHALKWVGSVADFARCVDCKLDSQVLVRLLLMLEITAKQQGWSVVNSSACQQLATMRSDNPERTAGVNAANDQSVSTVTKQETAYTHYKAAAMSCDCFQQQLRKLAAVSSAEYSEYKRLPRCQQGAKGATRHVKGLRDGALCGSL